MTLDIRADDETWTLPPCPVCGTQLTALRCSTAPEGAWALPCTHAVDVTITATRVELYAPQ